jgi:MFS family permease
MGSSSNFEQPTQVRYGVLALLCALAFVLYLDRVCISQAAVSIQEELKLDNAQMGYVFAAFMLSYALFEVPTGRWGDRFGSRKVLMRIVLWWSVFTALTGCVWRFSFDSGWRIEGWWGSIPLLFDSLGLLILIRFLFGAGEAGALPNMARVVARWFPADKRGPAQGLLNTSMLVGGATAPVLAAYLIAVIGWRWTFSVFAGVGVVWVIVFQRLFRDNPADHPWVNEAERRLIETAAAAETGASSSGGVQGSLSPLPRVPELPAGGESTDIQREDGYSERPPRPQRMAAPEYGGEGKRMLHVSLPDKGGELAVEGAHETHPPIPWGMVLSSANVWLLGGLMTCLASVTYFVYSWYPKYLQAGREVGATESGWLASLVMAGGAVGSTAGGFLCDALVRWTGERAWTLRLVGVTALVLASGAVWSSIFCDSALLASLLMGMTVLLIGVQITAWWAVVTAISGKHLGALFGLMNSMGLVGGVATQLLVGYYTRQRKTLGFAPRDQWDPAFNVFALVLLVGALAWLFIDARRSAVNEPGRKRSS